MGAEHCWIGVDLGTQSVRCLAVDDRGRTLAIATSELRSHRHGSRHEQDPAAWWKGVERGLRAVAGSLHGRPAGGIAVASTSGTVTVVDAAGRPRTAGIMYDDRRGEAFVDRVAEAGAEIWDRHGYRIQPSWALPKLLWLIAEGELPGRARLAHQADVVTARLMGRPVATDASHALKTGYDQLRREWPADVLARLDVEPALLPEVVPSGSPLGGLGAEAAEATGLAAGTPVIAGMTDGCAAQLGAGAVSPGSWNSVLGTTLTFKGVTDGLLRDRGGAVYSHRAPGGDRWLPGGASSTGAGVLARLLPDADLDGLTASAPRVRRPLACYPLAGAGERFPFLVPAARGFVVTERGEKPLDALTGYGDAEVLAAIAHGVAFVERLGYEVLAGAGARIDPPITLTGGATRNAWWNQLRCDVLGVPVRLMENAEPALGMAVLASMTGSGRAADEAAAMTHVRAILEPQPDARLDEGYRVLREAFAARGWIAPAGGARAGAEAA